MSCKRKNAKETEEKTSSSSPCNSTQYKENEKNERNCQRKVTICDALSSCHKIKKMDTPKPLDSRNVNEKDTILPAKHQEPVHHKCRCAVEFQPKSDTTATPKLGTLSRSKTKLDSNFEKSRVASVTKAKEEISSKFKETPESETTRDSETTREFETTHELKFKLMLVTKKESPAQRTAPASPPEFQSRSKSHSFLMQRPLNFNLFDLIYVCFMFVCFVSVWIFINSIFMFSCFYQFCAHLFQFLFKSKRAHVTETAPNTEPHATESVAEIETARDSETKHSLQLKLVFTTKTGSQLKPVAEATSESESKPESDTQSIVIRRPKCENASESNENKTEESTTNPESKTTPDTTPGGSTKFKSEKTYESETKPKSETVSEAETVPPFEIANETISKSECRTESGLAAMFNIAPKSDIIEATLESEIESETTRDSDTLPDSNLACVRELGTRRGAESAEPTKYSDTNATEPNIIDEDDTVSTYETKPESTTTPVSQVIPERKSETSPESELSLTTKHEPETTAEGKPGTQLETIVEDESITTYESQPSRSEVGKSRISKSNIISEIAHQSTTSTKTEKTPEAEIQYTSLKHWINELSKKPEITIESETIIENPTGTPSESEIAPKSTTKTASEATPSTKSETKIEYETSPSYDTRPESKVTSFETKPETVNRAKEEKSRKSDPADKSKVKSKPKKLPQTPPEYAPTPISVIGYKSKVLPETLVSNTVSEPKSTPRLEIKPESKNTFQSGTIPKSTTESKTKTPFGSSLGFKVTSGTPALKPKPIVSARESEIMHVSYSNVGPEKSLQSQSKSENFKSSKQTKKHENKYDASTQTDRETNLTSVQSEPKPEITPPRLRNEYELILMKRKALETCSCKSAPSRDKCDK